jgi:hypothetical protein
VNDVAFKAQLQMIIQNLKQLNVDVKLAPELKSALQPLVRKAA